MALERYRRRVKLAVYNHLLRSLNFPFALADGERGTSERLTNVKDGYPLQRGAKPDQERNELLCPMAEQHGRNSTEENPYVQPDGPIVDVLKIEFYPGLTGPRCDR